jgi:hypothetical protein
MIGFLFQGGDMQAWLQMFWQDLRFGMRMLRKNPGFSVATILTLALGIGGNTAIFTVTSAVLLKPLPYRDSRDLVLLGTKRKGNSSGGPGGFCPRLIQSDWTR